MPITIVFEGWGASGKGRLINELLQVLDPRGVKVYSTQMPNEEEIYRPFMWRFWTKIPERGRMVIYSQELVQPVHCREHGSDDGQAAS